MAAGKPWKIAVTTALSAHFKQPAGPSRAGKDWVVVLARDADEQRVIVRAYADDVGAISPEKEAQLVAGYVAGLLQSGWSPAEFRQQPGELTLPPQTAPRTHPPRSPTRPWYRFW